MRCLVSFLCLFLTFSVLLVANPKNYGTLWPIPLAVCFTGKREHKEEVRYGSSLSSPSAGYTNNINIIIVVLVCSKEEIRKSKTQGAREKGNDKKSRWPKGHHALHRARTKFLRFVD